MDRRRFLKESAVAAAGAVAGSAFIAGEALGGAPHQPVATPAGTVPAAPLPAFELEEATLAELQRGLQSGRWTAQSLAEAYLQRIEQCDGARDRLCVPSSKRIPTRWGSRRSSTASGARRECGGRCTAFR